MKKLSMLFIASLFISIAQAQTKHTVGEKWGGGIVFYITLDSLHGLIAETQYQGESNWYNAQDLINKATNHSIEGKNFTDWRLPTKKELDLMYKNKYLFGFASDNYWSSTEDVNNVAWVISFAIGYKYLEDKSPNFNFVWAVRSF